MQPEGEKLKDLANQWEEWKGPKMKEYNAIMAELAKESGRPVEGCRDEAYREEMRGMAGTIREAEERYKL